MADLVNVTIDDVKIQVPAGTLVVDAARAAGIDIPVFCSHPKLDPLGACRMCLVEFPGPRGSRLDTACTVRVSEGMVVQTDTQQVRDVREAVLGFILINHPLDCPICDKGGECPLQDQTYEYGPGASKFVEPKRHKKKHYPISDLIMLDQERCILCWRCIRYLDEWEDKPQLGLFERGGETVIDVFPGQPVDAKTSGSIIDICPVGALTSTDFRFKMRVWFLKQTNSIDTESSVGANTVVWSREGVIYRITPRRNDEVNDTWMADSGRLLYKQVRAENRLTVARIAGQVAAEAEAIKAAADLLKGGDAVLVASGRSTVEEQFLAKRLSELIKAPVSLVARIAQGDKLLVSADRNPNVRGALVTKLIAQLPKPQLTELGAQIDADHVRTILSLGEDLAEAGLTPAQLAKVKIVYLGTHANATSDAAHVVIPALTAFEKDGTFINQQFRVQKFAAAVPGPAGVSGDLSALAQLIAAAGGITPPSTVDAVWALLAAEVPALAGLSYRTLPETGRVIDHAEWAALPFPEGETLHYTPHRSA